MKVTHYLLGVMILMIEFSTNLKAQVNNQNEDGVYKIEAHHANDFVPGQVLVKLKDGQQAKIRRVGGRLKSAGISNFDVVLKEFEVLEMEQLLPRAKVSGVPRRTRAYNGDNIVERDLTQLYKITLVEEKQTETLQMIEKLKTLDEVEFAEPNFKVYIMADDHIADSYSNNPMVNQQWYLDNYGVKELWNKPIINKERPVIAIIDTGVDITHPDLKDNIWTKEGTTDEHGYDFINNTTKMRDNNKHGTHVAGIAAAANDGVGIVGANPRALIMPITVMQSDGTGDVGTLVKGIDYAVKNGANVLNMSIGTYANSSALRQALEKAYQSVVIVAAAGNDHKCIYVSHSPKHGDTPPLPCFPAAYSFVLGVQATTLGGGLASFSNYDDDGPLTSCESTAQDPDGLNYELKAPGIGILSCIPGGRYEELQGTSMASPLAAGAISALMMVKQYENQEILWGDLLHTNNIAEAYSVMARPAELDIMRVEFRDRSEQVDGDLKYYDVNVGETINIYPHIRTSFGSASNIKLKLEVPSGVEMITDEADFGYDLDAFGKMTSKNPLVMKIPNDMPNASEIKITVQATCKEGSHSFSNTFTLRVANMYTLKGMLAEDMILTPEHVYYVPGKFGVSKGVTLTIMPGTRIELGKKAGLYGFGSLKVKGTPESPIVFTAYDKSEPWMGIYSHSPSGKHDYTEVIYTNSNHSLFTLLPTVDTPIEISTVWQEFYYDIEENKPTSLFFYNYYENWTEDMTSKDYLLIDPNFITPAMLKMLDDWNMYYQKYPTKYTNEMNKSTYICLLLPSWYRYTNPTDTLKYCRIDGFYNNDIHYGYVSPYWCDCVINPKPNPWGDSNGDINLYGEKNVFDNSPIGASYRGTNYTNIVNCLQLYGVLKITNNRQHTSYLGNSNYFNNFYTDRITNKKYMLEVISSTPETVAVDPLPYFGTAREDILRPLIYEFGNTDDMSDINKQTTYATLDLSYIQKEPYKEAHGIVWKVLVNGKDAQDEQEDLLPLGVGKHKFEVYFNRPMNKAVTPQISFGVISPYTQHPISEEGSWNDEGNIYTAYVSIDGKTQSDGMNRICVRDAEDNEFFPCPIEATRFNFMLQAAGSMASGFQADAGLGCVNLKWNNENNDFEDAMGFNVYRFQPDVKRTIPGYYDENWNWIEEKEVVDTVRINKDILDITATSYIDDNVTPGQTYYYCYKVLSTALQEYDVSNVVAATPLTATRGDANGSGSVDVADVVTTVNYVTGLQPKPFVFDAADMNSDKLIDIFDVVGIIRGILNPNLLSTTSLNDEPAVYSIEDGVLYVESPVSLGGVQVQLTLDGRCQMEDVRVAEDLDGFETASAWLSDNDYLFLAYSMIGKALTPGKHALLHIGDAEITSLRLSDTTGKNVNVSNGDGTTGVDRMGKHVMNINGVYDLQGRKLSPQSPLRNGVYVINGNKVVK